MSIRGPTAKPSVAAAQLRIVSRSPRRHHVLQPRRRHRRRHERGGRLAMCFLLVWFWRGRGGGTATGCSLDAASGAWASQLVLYHYLRTDECM